MTATANFETERRALRDLLYTLEREKYAELKKEHHMEPYKPKTPAEIKQLLKDGKVTLHPDYDDEDHLENDETTTYTPLIELIAFNYQKPDKRAYKEGTKKLDKELAKLRAQIQILPPEETLKKLEAFEKTTIH